MLRRLREREENRSVVKHIRVLKSGSVPGIRGRDVAVFPLGAADEVSHSARYLLSTSATAFSVHDAWDMAFYRYICSGCMPGAARVRLFLKQGAGEEQAKKEAATANGLAGMCGAGIQLLSMDVNLSNSLDESECEVTFLGESKIDPYASAAGKKALAGLVLVCAGNAGAFGSRLMYEENRPAIEEIYGMTFSEISQMRLMKKPKPEEVLKIIQSHADIRIVKACGYGGVYGALWQLSQVIGTGLDIRQRDIPILQETVEIAEHFNQNPYMLNSSGSFLIICSDADAILRDFTGSGIPAAVIGTVSGQEACLIEESGRHLTPVEI